jgi:general secretion pathway protein M
VTAMTQSHYRAPFQFASAASSRRAAVAMLIAALVLAAVAVAAPAWFLFDRYDSTAAQMARQLRSYTTLNLQRPRLLEAVEAFKANDSKKYFVKGATAALAGADLQDIAKSIIEANGGRVLSSQLLAHKDEMNVRQVNATIQMTANIQNLRQALHALESREPYLFLDNLTIRAQVPSGFKPQPGFEPEVFVQFDVAALALLQAPSVATATEKKSPTGRAVPVNKEAN